MGHMVYTEGEKSILETYFQGVNFTGPFYLGLGLGAMPQSENATLADIVEVTGTAYARQPIQRSATNYGWSVVGDLATGAAVSWVNLDQSVCWTPADYMFLTLSPSGTDAPGVLITAVDLTKTIILEPQKKLKATFKFRQL